MDHVASWGCFSRCHLNEWTSDFSWFIYNSLSKILRKCTSLKNLMLCRADFVSLPLFFSKSQEGLFSVLLNTYLNISFFFSFFFFSVTKWMNIYMGVPTRPAFVSLSTSSLQLSPLFISLLVLPCPPHFPFVMLKHSGKIHMPIKVWPGSCCFNTDTCLYTLQRYKNRNLTHCK